jgi:galactokinase
VGELNAAGVAVPGARLEISGTIPLGAGLSSSAALAVALVLALLELACEAAGDRTELARLCSRIERRWVGAQTGLLDQLASLYGQRDRALRIDFLTLHVEPVVLELDGYRLITLDSGERRANATSGYNRRRTECARACELLGVESLRHATFEMARELPDPLDRRARHVIGSSLRVDQAVSALEQHDYAELGRLLDASHASLRDDYEVSTPLVEATVQRLKTAGALGARVHGGGFGGHVLGLFPPGVHPPEGAREMRPGPGARLLERP